MLLELNMIQTLALASVVLMGGSIVCQRMDLLRRYNIPAPVVGGFLFSILVLGLHTAQLGEFQFDTALQSPLMIAFFTTIGFGASIKLMRSGGRQVLLFWLLAAVLVILQNGLGILLSKLLGVHPFLGLLGGSISMTGGHATGAAFSVVMEEQYGFTNAVPLSMAAATFGLIAGGLLGAPLGTALIRRFHLNPLSLSATSTVDSLKSIQEPTEAHVPTTLKLITLILVLMWIGGAVGTWLSAYFTLPAYIGAMLVAAIARNVMESFKIEFNQNVINNLGTICLSLFLSMALMSLKLWELSDLALPLLAILLAQVILMAVFAYFVTTRLMGRDYDAAVIAGGHCGFGLGATPTAMANMQALVDRFGPAPRAFLVVPMVGAFFIDFTNVLIITGYMNVLAK